MPQNIVRISRKTELVTVYNPQMTQMSADENRTEKQEQTFPDKNAYGLAEHGPGFVEALKISALICVICGQFNWG
jgi:hypothetical protein